MSSIVAPLQLQALLSEYARSEGLDIVLAHVLLACMRVGVALRSNTASTQSNRVGSTNQFGDEQLAVDVTTDEIFFDELAKSQLVRTAASEEKPVETTLSTSDVRAGFSAAFDPLDGSSIVGANFAVGSIVGIWPGSGIVGRCGREQAAALIAMYGPRISVALAIAAANSASGKARCVEMTLTSTSSTRDQWDWMISRPQLQIAHKAKTFAPGNLRACADNTPYQSLVRFWMDSKFTLRYSGGLVPDVYHILIKGEGVMSNASSTRAPAKLRLAFEAAPIAFIIEHSGGLSCMHSHENDADSGLSLLDTKISTLNRRVGVCYGSSIEVQRFMTNVCSRPNSASKL